MSKLVLDVVYDYDFILIGLISHYKDYRLCFELNNKLNISLKKLPNMEILINKRKETSSFSFYDFENEDGDCYYLIANKGSRSYLIPEYKQFDYFLMIKQLSDFINEKDLLDDLKKIPLFLGAYSMEAKSLKSRENLIF